LAGTGTDFDLNNRDPTIESVDDDAPSDGINDEENDLDNTNRNIKNEYDDLMNS
jgi:hypothetical protein